MGRGDREHADRMAVEAMRRVLDKVAIAGRIVIGEGERDEAPMLYVGEELGAAHDGAPEVDIAVDPLEGTNLCATGSPGAVAVLAAAERGGLLHAPDVYMDKIVVGPTARGVVHLDAPVAENLRNIARAFERDVNDLVVVILERDRHQQLIADVRSAGARIRLITDGDLSAGIAAAVRGTGVHAVMGTGGAPEGVITAAAMRCLGGEIQGRLRALNDKQRRRLDEFGIAGSRSPAAHRRSGSGQPDPVRLYRSDGWRAARGRALLRRRLAHPHLVHVVLATAHPLRRQHPSRGRHHARLLLIESTAPR